MKKKLVVLLVLLTALAGGVFAQDVPLGGKLNNVAVDLGLVVGGARYERFLNSQFSVGVNAYWANSFIIFNEMEFGAFGRFFPWRRLYAELGLGFHVHSGVQDVDVPYGNATVRGNGLVTNTGFAITPGVGYKFDPGNPGGFYVEPGIRVPITIGNKSYWAYGSDDEFGLSAGFLIYCGLGWAF
jgi:hypothetical protein